MAIFIILLWESAGAVQVLQARKLLRGSGDMAKKTLEILTESMFYVLMSFVKKEMCGIETAEFVERKTNGRVKLGPGTLYTILGKFEEERFIEEIQVEGRKRTYRITDKGRNAYREELERLRSCIRDAESEGQR